VTERVQVKLVGDESSIKKISFLKIVEVLNAICESVTFSVHPDIFERTNDSEIDFTKDATELSILTKTNSSKVIYVTFRKFSDNFFSHETKKLMIISLYGWMHYSSLPVENGLVYFINRFLLGTIDNQFRHEKSIGCLYDFLPYKTDVDSGMRNCGVCEKCLKRLQGLISSETEAILADALNLATVVSNSSRMGTSILESPDKLSELGTENWSTFEDNVSQLYRELGGIVKQNVNLKGFQIDIFVEEETPSRQKVRSAIECKFYNKTKVGNREVNDFARKVKTLQEAGQVDKGILYTHYLKKII